MPTLNHPWPATYQPARLTRRGRLAVAATLIGAAALGATAQHWNPIARQVDRCTPGQPAMTVYEDGSAECQLPDGSRIVWPDSTFPWTPAPR